jgi:hypothetical protein
MVKLDFKLPPIAGLEIISQYAATLAEKWAPESLYRGHANWTWLPVASAFRPEVDGITRPDHLQRWKALAQRFVSPKPVDDIGWLVLAQHFGIPTALLDWTSNPLIALFFASQNTDKVTDGVVIRINRGAFDFCEYTMNLTTFAENRQRPLLIDTSAMNTRSTAQDSYMTLHTKDEASLEVEPIFRVEGKKKFAVRTALRAFGLSPERIYADLTVAAAQFNETLEFESIFAIDDF